MGVNIVNMIREESPLMLLRDRSFDRMYKRSQKVQADGFDDGKCVVQSFIVPVVIVLLFDSFLEEVIDLLQ